MLEPLIDDIFRHDIPGDFMEAGVFKGGVAIFMASALASRDTDQLRRMWIADSFTGLPESRSVNPTIDRMVTAENKQTKWVRGRFSASLEVVAQNFERCFLDSQNEHMVFRKQNRVVPIVGYFRDALPGPIKQLSLLRIDGDMYISIYDALNRTYKHLSKNGYVVFDDWKFIQSRQAILDFRQHHNIKQRIQFYNKTLDRMAYWKK